MLGLRTRLLGALLLTSVVTLGVAALALLPPLENRLSVQEESTTREALRSFKVPFEKVPLDQRTHEPNQDVLGDRRRAGCGRARGERP